MTTYTHRKDGSAYIYSRAAQYYTDLDFSQVMNCDKKPVIADLPPYLANDTKVGKLPYCCRNGTILPKVMDESKARSIFQLQVYKLSPDTNRTALNPPQKWSINGVLNPVSSPATRAPAVVKSQIPAIRMLAQCFSLRKRFSCLL